MERLYFGARARRRVRRSQIKRAIVVLWVIAVGAGVPWASAIFNWTTDPITHRLDLNLPRKVEAPAAAGVIPQTIDENRKTPSPDPIQTTAPSSTTGLIYSAAAEFGVSGSYMVAIAECESGLDPTAVNPAGYYGLFQFDQTTWASYGYGSIYDPAAQARTAARLIAAGQSSRWPVCGA
ncbi:MAG TPA: transglycosylase family protein [Actinomycetota bacterium]|nr:transglycosylase family protein [Actinomycetota bacterium]